ncbi:hypothetical protein DENSPDRAFT_840596 [Dentipellis sp. KUC8613]|nr:hypothetical protein DENSPDRAFT_840596 [Dentipellis sp. KUC8613]
MRSAFLLAFFIALAGRVLALNVSIGGTVGNISATDFLKVNDAQLISDCSSNCTAGNQALQSCTDNACFCSNETVIAITSCQQCMLTTVIAQNRKVADPRAGSAAALSAYTGACADPKVNITVPATLTAIKLPADWDGPQSLTLNTGTTVVAVIAGAVLGLSLIYVVNTM